ncbi:ubiquitin domain-containing protein [Reticulomyxa filosa]|uniref:Ubiquitin domain-containing protein n=1 Tax=Reticulomyxa filosa TaxID=46433 RepID=X6MLR7_RETFI|nr:ubiquitin domain-containing protein [Reticulomyxa filosa]|eukprot:ETO14020.1 ubiquitin domain-containing protein [Reticulomyxa filosa]
MPVKNMRHILSALSKSVKTLTRRAYRQFILDVESHVWNSLESMTDVELRELKKDILNPIVQAMDILLQREKSEKEIAQITETFQLTMGLFLLNFPLSSFHVQIICYCTRFFFFFFFIFQTALRRLTSQNIERRVNGVQHIVDICSWAGKSYSPHALKFITSKYLLKWIEENKLLEILFGPKSHPQLMKQATDILKFISMEGGLTLGHLSIIWGALEVF